MIDGPEIFEMSYRLSGIPSVDACSNESATLRMMRQPTIAHATGANAAASCRKEHAEEAAISDRSPVDHERAGDERGEHFAPVRRRTVRRTAPMTATRQAPATRLWFRGGHSSRDDLNHISKP